MNFSKVILYTVSSMMFFSSCHEVANKKTNKEYGLQLIHNNSDTLTIMENDSTYSFNLLPIITNLSNDTITFIKGLNNRKNKKIDIYPKLGINIYKDGIKIPYQQFWVGSDYSYLNEDNFIELLPSQNMLPFHGSYLTNPHFDYHIHVKIPVKGAIELEAYYNTLDTTQQKYHPFTNKEMKAPIAIEKYQLYRKQFLRVPHVFLVSNRIKFYIK